MFWECKRQVFTWTSETVCKSGLSLKTGNGEVLRATISSAPSQLLFENKKTKVIEPKQFPNYSVLRLLFTSHPATVSLPPDTPTLFKQRVFSFTIHSFLLISISLFVLQKTFVILAFSKHYVEAVLSYVGCVLSLSILKVC